MEQSDNKITEQHQVYSIGEVSELLGISKEMIRHYEKRGIISPERNESNYRAYSSSDIFTLCEMQQLKFWNIDLKKIADIKKDNYVRLLSYNYQKEIDRLETELNRIQLSIKRLKSLASLTETCKQNIGNYWVTQYEGGYFFEMFQANGDQIGTLKEQNNKIGLYKEENLAFMDAVCIKNSDHSEWGLLLKDSYLPAVSVSRDYAKYHFDPSLCLCTVIDIGEFGNYEEIMLDEVYQKMMKMGYHQRDKLQGLLISRGMENGQYSRFLKIQLPIRE